MITKKEKRCSNQNKDDCNWLHDFVGYHDVLIDGIVVGSGFCCLFHPHWNGRHDLFNPNTTPQKINIVIG